VRVPVPTPAEGEVVVRIEATPINPSDLGLLLGGADPTAFEPVVSGEGAVARAKLAPEVLRMMGVGVGRKGQAGEGREACEPESGGPGGGSENGGTDHAAALGIGVATRALGEAQEATSCQRRGFRATKTVRNRT
jgi:NADPH:quinone reductase-like Zn-dependent oxidoreductase